MSPDTSVLDTIDPDITETLRASKHEIETGRTASSTVAAGLVMGAVPLAIAALARDAFAQAPTAVINVLNFALTLEQLESAFYRVALTSPLYLTARTGLSPAAITAFQTISAHEDAHVMYLKTTITALGGTPTVLADNAFDFTAGNGSNTGPFLAARTNAGVLLALAQGFEDTGVRAYKGQAGNLQGTVALTPALQIHAVEARHAAQIRRLRGLKGWITGDVSGITAGSAMTPNSGTAQELVDRIYAGEENTVHKGANVAALGVGFGGTDAVQEAFDEPLTGDQVIAIVKDFIIGGAP